jgi:formate/nitrite transporter
MHEPPPHFDALLPPAMAVRAEEVGVRKAAMPTVTLFVLAVLAGAFIALGGVFATTVVAGAEGFLSYGVARLLAGVVFSLGLILVIVGGAELFTGNNLIVMAWASRRVRTIALTRNWAIVYAGNFVGAFATAMLVFISTQYTFGHGAVGGAALGIADAKVSLAPIPALALGILCNGLVCLAVWLAYSARSTIDRVAVIVPPIAAFVAAGFEHSVANMYFIPIGIMVKLYAPSSFWSATGLDPAAYGDLTVEAFVANLIPVTIGNVIGGTLLVGAIYWFVYLRQADDSGRG